MTRYIELTGGYRAAVDDADYPRIAGRRWRASVGYGGTVYAARRVKVGDRWETIYMHREVIGAGEGEIVDHADGDGLNNTRANLRVATPSQNAANARRRCDNASGYRGVSWYKGYGRWQATIRVRGRKKHLGYYATPQEAALAFDRAAREIFGDFARLNFPERVDSTVA